MAKAITEAKAVSFTFEWSPLRSSLKVEVGLLMEGKLVATLGRSHTRSLGLAQDEEVLVGLRKIQDLLSTKATKAFFQNSGPMSGLISETPESPSEQQV